MTNRSLYDDDDYDYEDYEEDSKQKSATKWLKPDLSMFVKEEKMPSGTWYRLVNEKGNLIPETPQFYSNPEAAREDARNIAAKIMQRIVLLEAKEEFVPKTTVSSRAFNQEESPPKEWAFVSKEAQ